MLNRDVTSRSKLRLSVLDQSPIAEGETGAWALRNSLDLAALADRLGYHRYWVAEHHGTPGLACAAPEALIGPIASRTSRIRVGSGGVMLPHYSSLKVAEVFSMFAGLYPDRIDLGIGRAPGTDQTTSVALQRDRRHHLGDDFPQQLAELLAYFWDRIPDGHPFANLATLPGRPGLPDIWLLGSSPQSGIWAAETGLSYMFADFISPTGAEIAARYRREFQIGGGVRRPINAVAANVICAPTDLEAQHLATSGRMLFEHLRAGRLIQVPPVETARQYLAERGIPFGAPMPGRRMILGSPATCRDGIEALARDYGVDEVMIVTITHDHAARLRSYELIADAFGLADGDAAAAQPALALSVFGNAG